MLRALHSRGYTIVVCTNESVDHLKNSAPLAETLRVKCGRVACWTEDVGVPVLALAATSKRTGFSNRGHSLHKQPRTAEGNAGMWDVAEELLGLEPGGGFGGGESFFVGDAAGREGDHGDDDRRLAASAGVRFWSETEFFERDPLRLLQNVFTV